MESIWRRIVFRIGKFSYTPKVHNYNPKNTLTAPWRSTRFFHQTWQQFLKHFSELNRTMAPDQREGGDITAAHMVLPEEEPSEIKEFYKDRTVFITGATGFLGKLILEKLLRCCPDVKHIYVLLREKKGKDKHKRFQEIFEVPVRPSHS